MNRDELVSTRVAYKSMQQMVADVASRHQVLQKNPAALIAVLGVIAERVAKHCRDANKNVPKEDVRRVVEYLQVLNTIAYDSRD